MGMSHRGRLNVLANIVGKSYAQIFREFEGELDPNVPQGSGDVKYHLGATGKFTSRVGHADRHHARRQPEPPRSGRPGRRGHGARQAGPAAATTNHDHVLPVLIHGDAAFAGQGVVAETLNLSELPGYDVGGTVHIVVNNQVGFTTPPGFARSTVYATDIAKAVQAPIFHVNGDDPEATVRVIQLAFEFRQQFKKDVVVDMVCYRRYGHNEGDEPAFTQPRMYEVIGQRRSVRKLYTELLVNRGDLTLEEAEKALEDFRARLEAAFEETRASRRAAAAAVGSHRVAPDDRDDAHRDRRAARDARRRSPTRSSTFPRRLRAAPEARADPRQPAQGVRRRPHRLGAGRGARVRLAAARGHAGAPRRPGHAARHVQPAARGARRPQHRSRVHAARAPRRRRRAVHDLRLGALGVRRARLRVRLLGRRPRRARRAGKRSSATSATARRRSSTSSSSRPRTSGASAAGSCCCSRTASRARAPSTRRPGSSASSCCAREDNMRVVYPTTAAQYFHVLRRQVHDPSRKPLIVMTPKRYLRMPATYSPAAAFESAVVPARAPRPRRARSRDGHAARVLQRQVRPRAARPPRRDAGAGRDRAARAAVPVARARDRGRAATATRTPR